MYYMSFDRNIYDHNDGGVNECRIGLIGRSVLLLSSFFPVADHREVGKIVALSVDATMPDAGQKIGFTVFFVLKSSHNILRRLRLLLLFTALGGESPKEEFADRLLLL